ncbi:hypothetical protein [Bacteroides acidifaciens]|uniref:hypothetical protein n=1 Tax=Bacteroides acidifaciens TaxID=85831 RepID=UPI002593A613|nr:hypothetical protein [Bacteroides acidifaciens]
MRKVTRKSLDELAKVMPVLSEMEQRSFIGGTEYPPSGSHTQPYTWEEYDRMVASGNWNGGYIVGFGYMSPDVVITGDQRTTSSFSGTALGYMYVSTAIAKRFGTDIQTAGEVLIYVNGMQVNCIPMTHPSGGMIFESGFVPVGETNFNLSQYSGYVEVKVRFGYNYANNGVGNTATHTEETIYASYR